MERNRCPKASCANTEVNHPGIAISADVNSSGSLANFIKGLAYRPSIKPRRRRDVISLSYDGLEPRQVLNAVPVAQDDFFYTPFNTPLDVDQVAEGLLKNDFDAEGSSLTVSLLGSGPQHGSLTLNSNGTFLYTPNATVVGNDSWLYRISDGSSLSRYARVSVKIGAGLSEAQETWRSQLLNDNPLHTGAQVLVQPLLDGQQLNFRTDKQGSTVVGVSVYAANGTATPSSITAKLVFGGQDQGTVTYSNTTFSTGPDKLMRFAMQAKNVDTGHYNWTMTVTLKYSGGTDVPYTFSGTQSVVNWKDSEYGNGWWLDGLDRLYVQDGLSNRPNGVLLVEGDGQTNFFPAAASPGTWNQAEGDLGYHTLTYQTGVYHLKDKWGNERRFNSEGRLTSVHQLKDFGTELFTYQYESTGDKRLTAITDQFLRSFTLQWPATNYRVICGGFGGDRQTEVGLPDNDGNFTVREGTGVMTVPIEPYNYTPPETVYQQIEVNGIFECRVVNLPSLDENEGPQSERTYQFDQFGLLSSITFHNMGADQTESHSIQISPTWRQGLRVASATPQLLHFVSNDNAKYTDERQFEWKFGTNRFGHIVRWETPLNAETKYEYNTWGELIREIGTDPDQAGPLVSPNTNFGYSSNGNLLIQKHEGGNGTAASELKWSYHSTLNLVLTATNELNVAESMTYHVPTGNLLSYADREGNTWTYVYDEQLPVIPSDGLHGRLRTITSPDPDGAGNPLQPVVTTYEYSSTIYTLPYRIFNADSSYREWTYDQWDRVTSERDELGRVTNYVWDEVDRLRVLIQPTGAIWRYNFGKNGQLMEEIDPMNRATEYTYDARYRMVSQTLPDPDGASGSLIAPVFTWTYNKTGEVVESTDPKYAAGIKDVFQYDSAGRMTKHIGPLTAQYGNTQETIYEYDLRDRLVRTQDPFGLVQKWQYDVRDRLTAHFPHDPDDAGSLTGPQRNYSYDAASRLKTSSDELSRITTYDYSPNGWLTKATLPDPDGSSGPQTPSAWEYGYDTLGRQTTVKNPLGRITVTAYDNRHRVASVTTPDPDGAGSLQAQVYSYQYDLVGNLKQINMPLSRIVQYDYDDLDRMIRVKLPHASLANQTGPEWNYQYGLTGSSNVTQQTDPLGRVTAFTYDNLYRQQTVTLPDPDGSGSFYSSPVWEWIYNDQTLLQSVKDPLDSSTTYGYDNAGRMTSMQQPGITGSYSYEYDRLNRLKKVTEPVPAVGITASVTEYVYDLRSRLQQVKDARDGTTTYGWNDANELLSLTDSVGNSTQWSYDQMGRKVLETNARGFTRFSEYDKNSNLTRNIDRNGRISLYTLDELDRLTKEEWYPAASTPPEVTVQTLTQGTTSVNEVQRISVANLSSSAPGTFVLGFNGRTTAPLNWDATATEVRDALVAAVGGVTADFTVTYALVSGVRQFTVTFTGANAGKNQPQMEGSAKLNALPATTRTLEWAFDDGGRLASTTDRNGALAIQSDYQFVYDALNRMTTETGTITRLTPQVRMTRTYDAVGNRTSLMADLVVGATVTKDFKNQYWFDQLNRVSVQTQTVQGAGTDFHLVQDKRATYTYNKLSQVEYLGRFQNYAGTGQSLRTVSVFDDANRLQTLSHRNIGTYSVLSNYAYGYDNMSRITSINHTAAVSGQADGQSSFSYDKTSQLTGADHTPSRPDESYQFDLNGNRTGGSYQTQTNNLTSEDSEYTYLYDKEGNRTRRTNKSTGHYEQYLWDHRNRLVQVYKYDATPELESVKYSYDTFNRMVFRQEVTWSPALQQNTIVKDAFFGGYEGINPTLQFETEGTTWTPNATAGDLKHRLWWGQGVDQLLADEQYSGSNTPSTSVGSVVWALADHLGTIKDLATFNGTSFSIANHRVFDSFGKLTNETNTAVDLDYAYTGKFFDEFTGLSHHWNRWYDPQLGKWISEDPIGFAGGDANLGRYVGNDVTGMTDKTGLMGDPIIIRMPSGEPVILYPPVDSDVIKRYTDQGGVVLQGNIPETKPVTPNWGGPSVFSTADQLYQEQKAKNDERSKKEAEIGWSVVHNTLDLAGFVPAFGAIPDIINAGLHSARGNEGEAAMSFVAALPFFGDTAKGIDKANDIRKGMVDKLGEGGFEKMRRGNNRFHNKKYEWLGDKLGLTVPQRERLHYEIHKRLGKDHTLDEVKDLAKELFPKIDRSF